MSPVLLPGALPSVVDSVEYTVTSRFCRWSMEETGRSGRRISGKVGADVERALHDIARGAADDALLSSEPLLPHHLVCVPYTSWLLRAAQHQHHARYTRHSRITKGPYTSLATPRARPSTFSPAGKTAPSGSGTPTWARRSSHMQHMDTRCSL